MESGEADVDGDDEGLAAGGANLGGDLFEFARVARGDDDSRAGCGQRQRTGAADAPARAGDECGLG